MALTLSQIGAGNYSVKSTPTYGGGDMNNPFNMKVGSATQQYIDNGQAKVGPTAKDGGNFLAFKDRNSAISAASDLLFKSGVYKGLTVDQALKKWSNNGYGGNIIPSLSNTSIDSLTPDQQTQVLNAMETKGENDAVPQGTLTLSSLPKGSYQVIQPSPTTNISTPQQSTMSKIFGGAKSVSDAVLSPLETVGTRLGEGAAAITGKIAGALGNVQEQQKIEQKLSQPQTTLTGGTVQPLAQGSKGLEQLAGEMGVAASYLIPYGRFAKLGAIGRIGMGALSGYGIDIASKMAQGQNAKNVVKPGVGTAVGTTLASLPYVGKALSRFAGGTLGVTTGTGEGVIQQAFRSGTKGLGSKEEQAFSQALMGNASPESIVQEAKDSLNEIITQRRTEYQKQLSQIAGNKTTLDVSSIIKTLQDQLDKFKIKTGPEGLDFSQSAIRFDKGAQADVNTIYEEMKTFGTQAGDRTAVGVDSLKQALGDLYSKSSNVRSLVTAVKNSARSVLSQIPGYDTLAKNYATKTDLISEIQKGLSLGDKSQIDTAYKKLTSALRLNNEFRKELILELDKASNGALSSKIAGEQLSELLPRGIMRPLEGIGAVGASAAGYFIPLLKFAAVASPKIVGSIVNALGLASGPAMKAFEALGGLPMLQRATTPITNSNQKGKLPKVPSVQMPGVQLSTLPFQQQQ